MPIRLLDFDTSRCASFVPNYEFDRCVYYIEGEGGLRRGFCKREALYRCLSDVTRPIPLSHSSVQGYLTCHYGFFLSAIMGIRVRDHQMSSAVKMGKLWDTVLTMHLGGAQTIDRDTNAPISIADTINRYQIDPYDVAKVKGLYRAYKYLDITMECPPPVQLQKKIDLMMPLPELPRLPDEPDGYRPPHVQHVLVTGYYDRFCTDHFHEDKLSSRPEMYLDPYFVQSQIGTYFLADPDLKHVIMNVVRTPALKKGGRGRKSEDTPEVHAERVFQDVISRSSNYFLGWNREFSTYGKKYHRAEFDLVHAADRYLHITREIELADRCAGWYRNDKACLQVLPGIQCEYLSICRTGKVSDEIYFIRDVEEKI